MLPSGGCVSASGLQTDFWFSLSPMAWWKKDPAFDESIRSQFGPTLEEAGAGEQLLP